MVALFVLGLVLFVKTEDLGNRVKEIAGESQSLALALTKFQNVHATENGNGSDLYKNLALQRQFEVKHVRIYWKTQRNTRISFSL